MNKKIKFSNLPQEISKHASFKGDKQINVEHIPHVLGAVNILNKFKQNINKKESISPKFK